LLETSKALDTIILKILLVKILMDVTMDNQQETNKIIYNILSRILRDYTKENWIKQPLLEFLKFKIKGLLFPLRKVLSLFNLRYSPIQVEIFGQM